MCSRSSGKRVGKSVGKSVDKNVDTNIDINVDTNVYINVDRSGANGPFGVLMWVQSQYPCAPNQTPAPWLQRRQSQSSVANGRII